MSTLTEFMVTFAFNLLGIEIPFQGFQYLLIRRQALKCLENFLHS